MDVNLTISRSMKRLVDVLSPQMEEDGNGTLNNLFQEFSDMLSEPPKTKTIPNRSEKINVENQSRASNEVKTSISITESYEMKSTQNMIEEYNLLPSDNSNEPKIDMTNGVQTTMSTIETTTDVNSTSSEKTFQSISNLPDVNIVDSELKETYSGPQEIFDSEELQTSTPLELPPIPITKDHPLFNDQFQRVHLIEREFSMSLAEFWHMCWSGYNSLIEEYSILSEHSYVRFSPWRNSSSPSCLERDATWIIALKGFNIGPSKAPVEQKQRVILKDKDHLEIDILSNTKNIPFGDDFSWRERWQVIALSPRSIKVTVEGNVVWYHVHWGTGMFKGTIDKRSIEMSKEKLEVLFDKLDQYSINNINSKKLSIQNKQKQQQTEDKKLNDQQTFDTNNRNIDVYEMDKVPSSREYGAPPPLPPFRGISKAQGPKVSLPKPTTDTTSDYNFFNMDSNLITFYSLCTILVLFIILIPIIWGLISRVAILEGKTEKIRENQTSLSRIAFLEYIIEQVSSNITQDTSTLSNYYILWKKNQMLELKLDNWKKQIQNMQKILRNDKVSIFETIELQQELITAFKEKDTVKVLIDDITSVGWGYWFFIWVFRILIIGFIVGCIGFCIKLW